MSMFAIASFALLAQTGQGQDMLAKHVAALSAAGSLSVTFSVERLPAAAQEYKLVFSRPNSLRVETPAGLLITDGKTVWEYTKATNEYTEFSGDMKSVLDTVGKDEFFAWAAFFMPDQFKSVSGAAVGKKLSMKGTPVTEVKFTVGGQKGKVGTLYFDSTVGLARGASVKTDTYEVVTKAKDIQVSDSADASLFAFKAPAGAKKVEIAAGDLAKWYHSLDEGLKVAKATGRMVFLDFNATWCGPCQMYKKNVFPTDEFKAMAKYFVFVDIDTDEQPSLAKQFGASAIPDLRFLKADGTQVHKVVGYKGMAVLDDFDKALQAGK
jgi:thiol-disulfide isomerase/thioredoxin